MDYELNNIIISYPWIRPIFEIARTKIPSVHKYC